MGEMCDFEAEYYPERWTERTAMKGKKKVVLTLSIPQWRKFRAIGGLPALKKLMAEAPTPQTAKPKLTLQSTQP